MLASLACAMWLAGGCSNVAPDRPAEAVAPLVWPRPPAPARIRHVRSVVTPADWGIRESAFGRLVNAVTGKEEFRFVRPTGVVERAGILFIADPGAGALFIFDSARGRAERITRIGHEDLVSPVALALGPADTLFLADSGLKKVYALDAQGHLRRTLAHDFSRPAALACDFTTGRLYVADSLAHQIAVFSAEGKHLESFGGNGRAEGQFNAPTHLAITGASELLVTDALNFRVQAFDRDGGFLWRIGSPGNGAGDFAAPKGVGADRDGNIHVVDALFDAVQIFRPDGTLLLGFGEQGTRDGQFWLPAGLFIDPMNHVYVADAYNQRIQIFRLLRPDAEEKP